jgi:pimeloyl-ACP methyl ester carboxylesterase
VSPSPSSALSGRVLAAADGVRISARHDPPADGSAPDLGFVVAHGFTGSWRRPGSRVIATTLAETGGVVSFDFRGHGSSGGRSTVGDQEVLDLDAALRWARHLGYRRLVPVGWSMGAGVAIRHAALHRGVDAVVAVSGPSRWFYRGTAPMRLLHRGVGTRIGRGVLALGFRTRIRSVGWELGGDPWPEPPDALVGRIAPVPLLVVHGDRDRFFPLEHARWLVEAARGPAELWLEPGFGHAEAGATPDLVRRIGAWADAATRVSTGPGEPGATDPSARMRE